MPTAAVPRLPLRSLARLGATLVLLALTGAPALAQFTPRFETLAPLSVNIGADPGKHSFVLADVNDDRRPDLITIEPDQGRVDVYINQGNGTFDLVATPGLAGDVTPSAVAVADIGSPFASSQAGKPDGFPDIVVGGDSGEVEVLFGHNDGQFDTPSDDEVIEPDATSEIIGLVTGDFDEGNGTDVAALDADGLVLLCNDGNGNLSACTGDTALEVGGDSPTKIVAGDFNGDANLDVAVLNPDEQDVGFRLGNGDGTFGDLSTVDVTVEATDPNDFTSDLAVARMDSDNLDDVVAMNNATFLSNFGAIVLGTSSGRFRVNNSFVADFQATAITLADFDAAADRATDGIIGYEDQSPSAVVGDGSGDLGDPFAASGTGQISSSAVLATADLGGDTLPDFVSLNTDGTQIRVAINKSNEATPTPGATTPATPSTPTPSVTGSLPPTGTRTATSTATFTITPTNTPTPIPTADYGRCDGQVGGNLAFIAAGDLDGDERPDLAASDTAAGVVRIVYNSAALSQVKTCARAMTEQAIPSDSVALGGATPGPIAIADLDHDGINEIAVGAADQVLILKRSSGTYAVARQIPVGGTVRDLAASYPDHPSDPRSRGPLDLNGDGIGDLVIANGTTTLNIVYGGDRQLPTQAVSATASCGATAVEAADFNADGRVDIAVGCGSRANWLQQQAGSSGNPSFQPKNDFAIGATIVGVRAGYLDRNGFADLLVTRGGTAPEGETYLFGNGTFALASGGTFGVGSNPIAGGLGRLNPAHNRFDAVIAGQDGGSVLQFAYNDGSGAFPGPVVMPFLVHNTPRALVVVDFDNDGQQDVALANDDGTLTILVSSEPPPTPTPTVTPTASATGTATATETPSATGTDTPTATPTLTGLPSNTPTATRTGTPGNTPTPTNTRGGIVLGSCAIDDSGGSSPLQMAVIAALLAAVRLLAGRRASALRSRDARR